MLGLAAGGRDAGEEIQIVLQRPAQSFLGLGLLLAGAAENFFIKIIEVDPRIVALGAQDPLVDQGLTAPLALSLTRLYSRVAVGGSWSRVLISMGGVRALA